MYRTDDKLARVHLQWFSDGDAGDDSGSGATDDDAGATDDAPETLTAEKVQEMIAAAKTETAQEVARQVEKKFQPLVDRANTKAKKAEDALAEERRARMTEDERAQAEIAESKAAAEEDRLAAAAERWQATQSRIAAEKGVGADELGLHLNLAAAAAKQDPEAYGEAMDALIASTAARVADATTKAVNERLAGGGAPPPKGGESDGEVTRAMIEGL